MRACRRFCAVITVCMVLLPSSSLTTGFGVIEEKVRPRIITPNGDGKNDIFWVIYTNPMDAEVRGKIYDLDGAEVTDMVQKTSDITGLLEGALSWDGKDGSGNVVPAGVYIYQLTAEDTVFNGTVFVAR